MIPEIHFETFFPRVLNFSKRVVTVQALYMYNASSRNIFLTGISFLITGISFLQEYPSYRNILLTGISFKVQTYQNNKNVGEKSMECKYFLLFSNNEASWFFFIWKTNSAHIDEVDG